MRGLTREVLGKKWRQNYGVRRSRLNLLRNLVYCLFDVPPHVAGDIRPQVRFDVRLIPVDAGITKDRPE